MSEAILKAMMQLFALIVDIDEIQEIKEFKIPQIWGACIKIICIQ